MLDDRKMRVLYAIIDSYIATAEPIGSRTISKSHDLGVSSATIRNEMSDLEELGYLNKTHTSSGRIPSDKAYRLYVDSLTQLDNNSINNKQKQEIRKALERENEELDQLIQNSAKLLSQITSYTALALSPQIKETRIKHVQLLPIGEKQVLLILVNESGIVKNTVFHTDQTIPENQLTAITNMLNERLKNKALNLMNRDSLKGMFNEFYEYKKEIEKLIPIINKSVESLDEIDLYADGIGRLLSFPEYKDIEKVRSIMTFIEDKDQLMDILLMDSISKDIHISIGQENIYDPLKDCSIITATYKLEGETVGKIGIIGPTRMDYLRLIKILRIFSENISEIIYNYNGSVKR
ncbi:MAG: heat-inducible transcriptional repressor HrcA [Bacillota bacterium]